MALRQARKSLTAQYRSPPRNQLRKQPSIASSPGRRLYRVSKKQHSHIGVEIFAISKPVNVR